MAAIFQLSKFHALYALRTIFRQSAMRNGYVRVSLSLIALAWLAFTTVAPFLFFSELGFSAENAALAEIILSFNTLVWIQLAFLIVKTVFLTADGIVELTTYFPVTNKQRAQSLLLFEIATIALILLYATFGFSAWALWTLHAKGINVVIFSMLLPALTAYALLTTGWNAIVSALLHTPMKRIATAIANLALTIPLLLTFANPRRWQQLIVSVFEGQPRQIYWKTALADLAATHHKGLVGTADIALCVLLLVLAYALTPKRPPRTSGYLEVPLPWFLPTSFAIHLAFTLRSRYTWNAFVMSIALGLWLHANNMPPFIAASLPCITGMYAFGAGTVRAWSIVRRPSPLLRYALLVASLMATSLILWLPLVLFSVPWRPIALADILLLLSSTALGSVMFTLVGVLFPTRRDNPFSTLVGFGSLALVALFVILVMNIFGLAGAQLIAAALAVLAAIILISITAISRSQRKELHASE